MLLENPGAFPKASEALTCILLLNLMWLTFLFEYISDCFSLYSASESPHCTLTLHLWVQLSAQGQKPITFDLIMNWMPASYLFSILSVFLKVLSLSLSFSVNFKWDSYEEGKICCNGISGMWINKAKLFAHMWISKINMHVVYQKFV